MSVAKFRKRPVVIEAIRWTGTNHEEVFDWAPRLERLTLTELLPIETLEGTMNASPGDWIIRGVNGEFYPCKPDVFDKTYEAVS